MKVFLDSNKRLNKLVNVLDHHLKKRMDFLTRKKRTNTHDRLLVPQHHHTEEIRKQELTTKLALDQDPALHLPAAQSPREEVDLVVPLMIQVF